MMKSVSENERKPMSKIIPIDKADRLRPDSLSPEAKVLWPEFYMQARSVKPLTDDDLIILAGLCVDWAEYQQNRAVVYEKGFVCTSQDGEQISRPEYWIMSAACERGVLKMRALAMTPLGRAELGL